MLKCFQRHFRSAYLHEYSVLPSVASMQQIVTSDRMESLNKQRKAVYLQYTEFCISLDSFEPVNIPFNGGYTAMQRSLLMLTPDSLGKLRYLHSALDRKARKTEAL